MRMELIPVVFGVLVCLIGAGIIYDAVVAAERRPFRERRRRQRAELDQTGEVIVGLGTICMGVALIGSDQWRWGTVVVITGAVLIVAGAVMNRVYLREMLMFRGAARRGGDGDGPPKPDRKDEPPMRIR